MTGETEGTPSSANRFEDNARRDTLEDHSESQSDDYRSESKPIDPMEALLPDLLSRVSALLDISREERAAIRKQGKKWMLLRKTHRLTRQEVADAIGATPVEVMFMEHGFAPRGGWPEGIAERLSVFLTGKQRKFE